MAAQNFSFALDPYTQIFNTMKAKVPVFDGCDPKGWLSQIDCLFDSYNTPEEWRVRLVSYHMEGEADDWLLCSLANNQLRTWPEFRFRFQQRFGFSVYDSVFKRMMEDLNVGIEKSGKRTLPISSPSLSLPTETPAPLISPLPLHVNHSPVDVTGSDSIFLSQETEIEDSSLCGEKLNKPPCPSSPTSLLPPLFPSVPALLLLNMPKKHVLPETQNCPQPISSTTTTIDTCLPVSGHKEDEAFGHSPRYLKKDMDGEILVVLSALKLFDQLTERVVCSPEKGFFIEKIDEESIWSFDPGGGLISIEICTRTTVQLSVFGLEYILGKIPPNYFLVPAINVVWSVMWFNILYTWRTSIFQICSLIIMVDLWKCLQLMKRKNSLIQYIKPTYADESALFFTFSSYVINSWVKVAYSKATCAKNCDYLQTFHAGYSLCVGYSLELVTKHRNYDECMVLDMEVLHINCCELGARFVNQNNGDVELLNGARHGKFQESGCAEYFDCTQRTEVYFSLVGGNIAEMDVVVELSDLDIVEVRGFSLFYGAYDKSSLDEQFPDGVNLAMAQESCLVFDPGGDIPAMSSYKKVIYGEKVELHGAETKDDMSLELWPFMDFFVVFSWKVTTEKLWVNILHLEDKVVLKGVGVIHHSRGLDSTAQVLLINGPTNSN